MSETLKAVLDVGDVVFDPLNAPLVRITVSLMLDPVGQSFLVEPSLTADSVPLGRRWCGHGEVPQAKKAVFRSILRVDDEVLQ